MVKYSFFLSYRKSLYANYSGLFNQEESDGSDELDDEPLSIESIKAKKEEANQKKWIWVKFIYDLCDGDITKTSEVLEQPFITCLIWKSMEIELKISK